MLVIFEKFFDTIDPDLTPEEIFEELADARFQILFNRAVDGFGMDWEDALNLVRKYDGELSAEDKVRRRVLLAAFDNLVDFAVAQEYQMLADIAELEEDEEENEDNERLEEEEEEEDQEKILIFTKYNRQYAATENKDVEYAMMVAAGIIFMDDETSIMYMTMGDERVRPWHLQFEGFTAPKREFPMWLVPPIEHQCRCYLVEVLEKFKPEIEEIQASAKTLEMPDWFNRTFKESVAFGGRIFSDEHPYFDILEEDMEMLTGIATRIKQKYLNG